MAELGERGGPSAQARQQGLGRRRGVARGLRAKDGWFRLDQAQRRLEAWVANLDDEPEERPLGVVRRAYEDACHAMAEGFTKALGRPWWSVPGALHQTRIWSEVVSASPSPSPTSSSTPCASRWASSWPSACRRPPRSPCARRRRAAEHHAHRHGGAHARRFGELLGRRAEGQARRAHRRRFLPDLAARKKHAAARVPKLVDLALDELLSLQPSKLAKKLDGAQVVVVRSQEIDHAGETGFTFQARQVMDTVIDNLARAIASSRRRASSTRW
jgi:hypothetical protein